MIPQGDCCTLSPYGASEVMKFVFDGSETFHELPQAFFHYVAFASTGHLHVVDLQGAVEDEGDFLLLDPAIHRSEKPHPRCAPMCQVFDPQRKSAHAQRLQCCGL